MMAAGCRPACHPKAPAQALFLPVQRSAAEKRGHHGLSQTDCRHLHIRVHKGQLRQAIHHPFQSPTLRFRNITVSDWTAFRFVILSLSAKRPTHLNLNLVHIVTDLTPSKSVYLPRWFIGQFQFEGKPQRLHWHCHRCWMRKTAALCVVLVLAIAALLLLVVVLCYAHQSSSSSPTRRLLVNARPQSCAHPHLHLHLHPPMTPLLMVVRIIRQWYNYTECSIFKSHIALASWQVWSSSTTGGVVCFFSQ